MPPYLPPIELLAALGLASVGYLFERRDGHLPNWLTLGGIGLGLLLGVWRDEGLSHLASFAAFAVPLFLLFRVKALGGGGVKLGAGAGACAGLAAAAPLGGALVAIVAGFYLWARTKRYRDVPRVASSLILVAAAVAAIAIDLGVRIARG